MRYSFIKRIISGKRLAFLTPVLVLIMWQAPLSRAMNASTMSTYNEWRGLTTDRLMEMGKAFDLRNSSDSALVCYSVVADRLRGSSLGKKEKELYSRALNNIGYIYSIFLYDYPKSIEFLQDARKVADECGYKEGLVYANLNLGGIYLSCNVLYGNGLFSEDIYRYLEEAFRQGLELGEYDAALASFINMGQLFFESPQPVTVRKISSARSVRPRFRRKTISMASLSVRQTASKPTCGVISRRLPTGSGNVSIISGRSPCWPDDLKMSRLYVWRNRRKLFVTTVARLPQWKR